MSELANRLSALSPHKRALFEQLLNERKQTSSATALPIARRNRPDAVPLSFEQKRLWFLDRCQPGTAVYNISAGYRFQGDLDLEAVRKSLYEIVRRHEILRVHFVVIDGQPIQHADPPQPIETPLIEV